MTERSQSEDENRGLAFAALSLVKALVNALEQKGVLEDSEVQGVLDEALRSMEYRHQDASTDIARRILEAIAITRTQQRPSPD